MRESIDSNRTWRVYAGLFIALLTVLRLAFLGFWCSFDLAPDEAHYWDWSRNLDWSYYSKGPGVAWLIRASLELFGSLSISLTGSELLAVRLPSVICGSLLLVALFQLTTWIYRSEKLSFVLIVLASTLPVISAGSMLMTIDSPFVCCWAWALVFGYLALFAEKKWAWPALGLIVGLGILAKYTMALWFMSLGCFLLFTPDFRKQFRKPGVWIAGGISLLCCIPIIYWNWKNDWVTIKHVAVQAGVPMAQRNSGIRWLGPLEFLGGQFGLLIGYWFVAWAAAMIARRPGRETDPKKLYLWWMSFPTVLLFGLVTFKAAGQINWPVAAYISGIVLTVGWLHQQWISSDLKYAKLSRTGSYIAACVGLLLTIAILDSRPYRGVLAAVIAKEPTLENPYPLRQYDPTCRLRGWNYLANEVDQIRDEVVKADGVDPVIAGFSWMMPGQLGFFCKNHPQVYSIGLAIGDRHSQYDLWHPNPLADAQVFRGRTFLIVGAGGPDLTQAFDEVAPARQVTYREAGQPISGWSIWVCRGFRGFNPIKPDGSNKTY